MWTLTKEQTGEIHYLLPEKEKHSVGRVNTDLVLSKDTSISRSHACFYVSQKGVKLVDVGSKYGTFHNENIETKTPMQKNVPVEVKDGDRVKFGMLENEWLVGKLSLCTFTSTLTLEDKAQLQQIFRNLGDGIVDKWEKSCTHLTMSEITVTHKLLQALVENLAVVSIGYWQAFLKNIKAGKTPPKPEDFLPICAESLINQENISFGCVVGRKTVFAGKLFVFMSSTPFEKYKPIIESAGGRCENLYKGVSKSALARKNVVVIRGGSIAQTQCSQTVESVHDFIKSKGRRLVPDAEIGLAILNCSTTKYCNPEFNMVNEFAAETNDVIPHSNIIAKHTPHFKSSHVNANLVVEIPESEVHDPTIIPQSIVSETPDNEEMVDLTEKFIDSGSKLAAAGSLHAEKLAQGKRKRTNSNSNQAVSKKLNTERSESQKSNSECVPMSQNLIVELSSQPANVPTSSTAKQPTPSTSRRQPARNARNTSQITRSQNSEAQLESSAVQNKVQETRKRARIANICSDDDDDDLFAFDSSTSKKQKNSNQPKNLRSSSQQQTGPSSENNMRSIVPNLKTLPSQSATSKSTKEFKRSPRIIDVSNTIWISKSMNKMKLDCEGTKENIVKEEDPETSAWINSLRGGFEVKVREMKLVVRSCRDPLTSGTELKATSYSGKNFKAFVKKNNYTPQRTILTTIPVYIGIKSTCDF